MGMELSTANRWYVIWSMTCGGSSIFCPCPVLSCPVSFDCNVCCVGSRVLITSLGIGRTVDKSNWGRMRLEGSLLMTS